MDNNDSGKIIKAYKGFNKDLTCHGFQYKIGKTFKIKGNIKCCERGFHACESPLEVFEYYDMLDSRFCEVEQTGNISRDGFFTKVCSSKIKIVSELKLADIIKLGIEQLINATSSVLDKGDYKSVNDNGGDSAQISSSGNGVRIGSSGNGVRIGSSGRCAQISSSGNFAHIGSSGSFAQIGSSSDHAIICASGIESMISASGHCSRIGSNGHHARICSSGVRTDISSNGNFANISSNGDLTCVESSGNNSIVCCTGVNSRVKAKKGSWITLAEWEYNQAVQRDVPVCVKTEYVDGERIKEDTWYVLSCGKFVEYIP